MPDAICRNIVGPINSLVIQMNFRDRFWTFCLIALVFVLLARAAAAQVFVADLDQGTVGEYGFHGVTINTNLISGFSQPTQIALSGSDLFVESGGGTVVGEYTLGNEPGTIASSSPQFISGLFTIGLGGLAVTDSDLFVVNNASYGHYQVSEYTLSGALINASLISFTNKPRGITVSGSNVFLAFDDAGTVGEYTLGDTPGTIAASYPSIVTGLDYPISVAASGSSFFVLNEYDATVGKYTLGSTPGTLASSSTSFVIDGETPQSVAVSGSDLFVGNYDFGTISEYDAASGVEVAPAAVYNIPTPGPYDFAIASQPVPEPSSAAMVVGSCICLIAIGLRRRKSGMAKA
jgi:hypothetical protein